IYEERLARDADRGGTLIAMGAFLYRAGRVEEAKQKLAEGLQLKPDHVSAHVLLGDIAIKQGRKADAITHYENALRQRPEWPELKAYLAKLKGDIPAPK